MGAKFEGVDKRVIVSPQAYNIPSKIIEQPGKSMGQKLKGSLETNSFSPGPGAYVQEKAKIGNLSYSMGAKLTDSKGLLVPGPGAYDPKDLVSTQVSKFGSGGRGKVELPTARVVPGPGEHSPDYKALKTSSPRFGFGSSKRADVTSEKQKQFPGPGNYDLGGVIGKDGQSKTMHGVITYNPENKEQSYKPGPGNYDPDPLKTKKKDP
jgi:hypothetical protein